jgi:hypothetical protein
LFIFSDEAHSPTADALPPVTTSALVNFTEPTDYPTARCHTENINVPGYFIILSFLFILYSFIVTLILFIYVYKNHTLAKKKVYDISNTERTSVPNIYSSAPTPIDNEYALPDEETLL